MLKKCWRQTVVTAVLLKHHDRHFAVNTRVAKFVVSIEQIDICFISSDLPS